MPAKGAAMPPETRAKISATMRGKRKTKAHRQAIARGVFRWHEQHRNVAPFH